jgi:hypothetical protein
MNKIHIHNTYFSYSTLWTYPSLAKTTCGSKSALFVPNESLGDFDIIA